MTWDRDLPKHARIRRSKAPTRKAKLRARNEKRAARRTREYRAFINGPVWRQQKQRVHQRDGYQCTQLDHGHRCAYTREDGPLHAHHERYHPRGIQYTPDKDVRTICPTHHDREEAKKWWRAPRSY